MIDQSNVDLVALIERYAPVRFGKEQGRGDKKTRKAACPWCGGTDRFAVFVSDPNPRYICGIHGHGCGAHGDAIKFLREYAGMTWREACEMLDIDPAAAGYTSAPARPIKRGVDFTGAPGQEWQEAGLRLVRDAHRLLLSDTDKGRFGLENLTRRGISLEAIKHFQLGYCPSWHKSAAKLWGLAPGEPDISIAEGIIIPTFVDGVLWHIDTRRLTPRQGETPEAFKRYRYHEIPGGVTCLFNADGITADTPVLLTEGRIDAISAWQECGDTLACVATGSTGDSQDTLSALTLAVAPLVLIAFDDDQPGEVAAAPWCDALENALRYAPLAHDVNDMLVQGESIRQWAMLGLALAEMYQQPSSPEIDHRPSTIDRQPRNRPSTIDHRPAAQQTEEYHTHETLEEPEPDAPARAPAYEPTGNPELDRLLDIAAQMAYAIDDYPATGPGATVSVVKPGDLVRPPYVPLTFLGLARERCSFIVASAKGERLIGKECGERAVYHGWCAAHKRSHDLLALGALLGYPHVQLNASRGIQKGQGPWEAYAERAPESWLKHDLLIVKCLVSELDVYHTPVHKPHHARASA